MVPRNLVVWGVVCVLLLPSIARAQCFDTVLLTVSEDDNLIREVDLDTLATVATHPVTVPGLPAVLGLTGISRHTITEEIFILMRVDQPAPLNQITLGTYDLENDLAFSIGNTVIEFVGLTFDDSGACLSISSDAASPPNAFCELSQTTGAPTDLCSLGNGDDGDAVAYHTGLTQVFHAAGNDDVIFEEVVSQTQPATPCNVSDIDISSTPLANAPLGGMTWWDGGGAFLWSTQDADNSLYSVTTAGAASLLGSLDHTPSGMAVILVPVVCPTELFIRGDVDNSGGFSGLVDGLFLLNFQFIPGSPVPQCMKAADADGNGSVSGLVDGLYILNFQFVPGSPQPPPPFTSCGDDPASPLSCDMPLTPPC